MICLFCMKLCYEYHLSLYLVHAYKGYEDKRVISLVKLKQICYTSRRPTLIGGAFFNPVSFLLEFLIQHDLMRSFHRSLANKLRTSITKTAANFVLMLICQTLAKRPSFISLFNQDEVSRKT